LVSMARPLTAGFSAFPCRTLFRSGDLGVRELELTRLDDLEIGSLKVHSVPSIIKNPPLHGLPTREMESFSPLALGLSVVIDYDRDRKSTRLNSSHVKISYAAFCLK